MKKSHFCNESEYCPMRLELESSTNKLDFLRSNWPDLWEYNKISALSMKDLKCALCVTNTTIDASNAELYCPNREIIRLDHTRMYIQQTYEIHKLQEELQKEFGNLKLAKE